MTRVSILIPAHNEAQYLSACLEAMLLSDTDPDEVVAEVVVIANGCIDATVSIARAMAGRMAARGWTLQVLELPEGGKLKALNRGETAATGDVLIYLDADVHVSPPLVGQIVRALDIDAPRYASGQPHVLTAQGRIARAMAGRMAARGWALQVLELPEGGKLKALNKGEAAATGDVLIYLDADVHVSPPLVGQIVRALDIEAPRYASGQPHVVTAQGKIGRAYARFWQTMPFMTQGVAGFGLFAMNRAGRARWGQWPDIISDDTFARLHFAPAERIGVAGGFTWPMVEGFGPLVRVRRRQDRGNAEIAQRYPALLQNADPHDGAVPLWRRGARDPAGLAVYLAVRIAGRLPILRSQDRWARGR